MRRKYYTPESNKELIDWVLSEGNVYLSGVVHKAASPFRIIFPDDCEDNLLGLISFIKDNNNVEYDNSSLSKITISLDNYLIPYLNKEDIEELGFKEDNLNSNPKRLNLELHKNGFDIGIVLYNTTKLIIYNYNGKETMLFTGDIKNKSELKKLLKQLNII